MDRYHSASPPSSGLPKPAAPPGGRSGLAKVLIVVGAAMLGLVLLALALPIAKAVRRQFHERKLAEAARILEEQTRPLSPKEEASLRKFVEKLLAAVKAGDEAALKAAGDYTAFTDIVCADIDLSAALRNGVISGLENTRAGFFEQLSGMDGRLLRIRTRKGKPAVTCRFDLPNGGANFLDLIVRRDGRGFRVIDVYNFLIGICALKAGDLAAAKDALRRGEEQEPGLQNLKNLRILIQNAESAGTPEDQ